MKNEKGMLEIVSCIYDTVLNPNAWLTAGQLIRKRYHAVYSGLYVYDVRDNALVHDATAGTDESFVNLYANEFCYIDPYRYSEKFIAANPNIPLTDKRIEEMFFSIERNHSNYPYFGEYWHKYECNHAIGTLIDLPNFLRAGLCAPRSSSIGAYTYEEKLEFEIIRKSFNKAMTLSQKIDQLGYETLALDKTINLINHPVFIVDQTCRILISNNAGKDHLTKNSFLKEVNGSLVPDMFELRKLFFNSVSRACNESLSEDVSLSRKYYSGPMELLICPIQKISEIYQYNSSKAVIILHENKVSNSEIIAKMYKLTCAEQEILKLVCKNYKISQMSVSRNTSKETIKSQLRNIYQKTNTQNMKELKNMMV